MGLLKFYLTPILTLLIAFGILLGGAWLWFGFGLVVFVLVGGDAFLGNDFSIPNGRHPILLQAPLFMALPILTFLLLVFAWSASSYDFLSLGSILNRGTGIDFLTRRSANSPFDYLGAILGVGLLVAGYGTNSAHELTHQTQKTLHTWVGRWILSMSCNADFAIEHVFGHHAYVGTEKDPATAKRGESAYSFFVRSTVGGHLSAWQIEKNRLRKAGISALSFQNQMLTGYAMSIFWISIFGWAAGAVGIALFFLQAFVAKFILEVTNYMEHYGLIRSPTESVKPHHSWNTNRRMSYLILYSLVRHSAHHERSKVAFWKLNPYPHAPEMVQGYLTTIFICLVPSAWFRMMEPRLQEWDKKYAVQA